MRLEARLAVRSAVLAVSLQPAVLVSYGTVKLGLRHAVSAYRGPSWGGNGVASGQPEEVS